MEEKMKILRNNKGFTLIELVIVIVVLGVLSAVAIPQFINMQQDAQAASNVGWVAGLRSCLAINFAGEVLGKVVTPSATTVAGPALPASGNTVGEIDACVTGSARPASLVGVGTGTTWVGLSPLIAAGNPTSSTWTVTAGAALGDPSTIVCSNPTTNNC